MHASNHSLAVGHADQVSYYAASRAAASWPHQVGVIPAPAHCFQQRPALDAPSAPTWDAQTGVRGQVLVGTAGVGKSQLAAQIARTAWNEGRVDLLVWVTATDRAAILAAYAQAVAELTGADTADPEQAAREFLAWLRPGAVGRPCRWLIVLDGLADPDDLRGLWPPDHAQGRTVVTTWRRDLARTGLGPRVVTVGAFTPAEASAYLTGVLALSGRAEPPEQIEALAQELGYLPVALAQAAAYLNGAGLDCAAYRRLLGDGRHRLADLVPDPGALPDGQSVPLAQLWDHALERVDALAPVGAARILLELAASLDPEGFPDRVLISKNAREYLTEHPTTDLPEGNAEVLAHEPAELLALLHRWSLIDHTPDDTDRAVRIHPVLQRAVRESAPADRSRYLTSRAGHAPLSESYDGALDECAPISPDVLRANVDAMVRHDAISMLGPDDPARRHPFWELAVGFHELVFRPGEKLAQTGRPADAVAYFEALTATATRRLGPQHRHTFRARGHLADSQARAGDLAGGIAAYRQLITEHLHLLGPEYGFSPVGQTAVIQITSDVRRRLVHWLQQNGDAAAVVAVYRQIAADEQHVTSIVSETTLRGLADWLGKAGDAAGAAAGYREIVNRQMGLLGPSNESTFEARSNFARWLGQAGDPGGAATVLGHLLNDQLQLLWHEVQSTDRPGHRPQDLLVHPLFGVDHLGTFKTRTAHACWRGFDGDAAGAATVLTELLTEQLRVLGHDHPDIHTTRQGLAYWHGQSRRRSGAP